MRDQKLNLEVKPRPLPANGMDYYWCVNCGNYARFKPACQIVSLCKCHQCGYNSLTEYDLEEIMSSDDLKFKFKDVLDGNPIVTGS